MAPAHVAATDGEITSVVSTGNQRHVIVPGAGPVLVQAGRFTLDPATGELSTTRGLDIPAGSDFCAALSA